MKLEDLLQFDDVIIQCHDNPDADAIASGFALWEYLTGRGKSPRLVYSGKWRVSKPNLKRMCQLCRIPLEYQPDPGEVPEAELLVMVDCQPGQNNVSPLRGRHVAVIDHHTVSGRREQVWAAEVHDSYGACATVLWELLCRAGCGDQISLEASTALYFGLYMDTTYFKRLKYPLDQDMVGTLSFDPGIFGQLKTCIFSQEEIAAFGKALTTCRYNTLYDFAVVESPPCDPNLLGAISDQMMEVQFVDVCAAYCLLPDNSVKLSVRSYDPDVLAYRLVEQVTLGMGGGGGSEDKAGGTLTAGAVAEACREDGGDGLSAAAGRLIYDRIADCLARGSAGQTPDRRTVDGLLQGTPAGEFLRRARQGEAEAQHKLGVCFAYGRGVRQDWDQAVEWYRKAAEQGCAAAQKDLGVCYARGKGVAQDWGEAVRWYRLAAENGDTRAQCNLAQRFYKGEGIRRSFEQAAEWYRKAAEQGYSWAQYKLGRCFAAGEGVPQDWKQAVHWYTRAAEQGVREAMERLAACYENGLGVARAPERAALWREKAGS